MRERIQQAQFSETDRCLDVAGVASSVLATPTIFHENPANRLVRRDFREATRAAYLAKAAEISSLTASPTIGTPKPRPNWLRRMVPVARKPIFSLPPICAGILPAP